MNYKKLIPLLLCGTFAMTGCNRVKNVKQKTKKGDLFTSEVVERFYKQDAYTFGEAHGTTKDNTSFDGYTKVSSSSQGSKGFLWYQKDADSKYYLYSLYKNAFLPEGQDTIMSTVYENDYVGCFVKINNSVYDGLGNKIITLEKDSWAFDELEFDKETKEVHVRYYDGTKLKEVKYVPGSEPVQVEVEEKIGDPLAVDLTPYGHKDYSFLQNKYDVNVYNEKGDLERTIHSKAYKAYSAIIGDRIYWITNTSQTMDAKDYEYSNGYTKYKQEIYSVDYITGKEYSISSDYYIESISTKFKDEKGFKTFGTIKAYEIRKDKTYDTEAPKFFMVDQDLAIHEEVSNGPFFNGTDGGVTDVRVIKSNDKVSYLFADGNKKGYLYNEDFEVIKQFPCTGNSDKMKVSKNGQYIVMSVLNGAQWGIVKLDGTIVAPFEFTRIDFDPEVAEKMIAVDGATVYELKKGEDGKFEKTELTDVTGYTVDNGGRIIRYTDGTKKVYTEIGEHLMDVGAGEANVYIKITVRYRAVDECLINVNHQYNYTWFKGALVK